jgi:hypothetical protein
LAFEIEESIFRIDWSHHVPTSLTKIDAENADNFILG